MHLIVGLGNPESKYRGTRHNVGFEAVDSLAEQQGWSFGHQTGNALIAEGRMAGREVVLAKPLTYMNRSGQAVKYLVRQYEVDLQRLLVLIDDIHLEPGRIRLRKNGSAGGHNGMQDIIEKLETKQIPRLRIGIGQDFRRGELVDYVLSPFTQEQRPFVDEALVKSRQAIELFIREGTEEAMNRYN